MGYSRTAESKTPAEANTTRENHPRLRGPWCGGVRRTFLRRLREVVALRWQLAIPASRGNPSNSHRAARVRLAASAEKIESAFNQTTQYGSGKTIRRSEARMLPQERPRNCELRL